MAGSVSAKKRVTLPDVGLFSDGTAVKLVVSDGRLLSEPDQLTVTAAIENLPPIANAGGLVVRLRDVLTDGPRSRAAESPALAF